MPASSTPREFSRKRKLVYGAIVCLAFFAVVEVVLRLTWSPKPTRTVGARGFVEWLADLSTDDPLDGPLYDRHGERLWALVPGARIESKISHRHPESVPQTARITINARGYRGRLASDRTDVYRVLCLGDSNFFGYPLDDGHAFPAVFEQRLAKALKRPVEVINGGVPGYTVAQGRRLFDAKFRGVRFDAVLLSFLNNDAWPQPKTDAELFAAQASFLTGVADVARMSRLFEFMVSFVPEPDPKTFEPRVPLDDFVAHYESLIAEVTREGAGVVIVDHCAHQQYAPYSQALQQLAQRRRTGYLGVARRLGKQLKNPAELAPYAVEARRVTERWGPDVIRQRPYLMLYAEYKHPEHLNEVGTAWLSDLLVPLMPK